MSQLGIDIGLKSLLASQSALETVGHNISNANTPGYSRQTLALSSEPGILLRGLAIGRGVSADVVRRTVDLLLSKRLVEQKSSVAELDARLARMQEAEALLAEPGASGLGARVEGFYAALSSLAANPQDPVLRGGAVQSASGLAARFRDLAGGLAALRSGAASAVASGVGEVNALARTIADLNGEIRAFEGRGAPANDLRDRRDLAIERLGELVDVSVHEGSDGAATVLTGGALLVGGTRAWKVKAELAPGGAELSIEGRSAPLEVTSGQLGGLLRAAREFVPGLQAKLDLFAKELARAANRAHSTGVPAGGPFDRLQAQNAFLDSNGDGEIGSELLAEAGLPFEVGAGGLYVTTTDLATGATETTRIEVDPSTTTVDDLVAALDGIAHLSAGLDAKGRLELAASAGHRFDFAPRLDAAPDPDGTFGGAASSLGAASGGPYALSSGATLQIAGPGGAFTLAFDAADFADVGAATAEEVAAAINADPQTSANGMRAAVAGDRVVLQSTTTGPGASFTLSGGSALGAFGWTAGTTVAGDANAVDVSVTGAYAGSANALLTFVASGDGAIGTTPGLQVDVLDANGNLVATLDVGAGYTPGTEIAVADGIEVSFGFGTISATDHDAFALHAIADSDEGDLLVAVGLNALFTGSTAADLEVRGDLALDPGLFSASASGAPGDNGALLALVDTRSEELGALAGADLGGYWGGVAAGLGYEIASASGARELEGLLMDGLRAQREQVSGVDVDEELVDLVRFEQAFGAAARFIQVVQSTHDEVLQLL